MKGMFKYSYDEILAAIKRKAIADGFTSEEAESCTLYLVMSTHANATIWKRGNPYIAGVKPKGMEELHERNV